MFSDLKGKSVLITGGSRGIGRAIALALAEHGADVAVTATRAANAEATAGEIRALGLRSMNFACDVTSLESVEQMAKAVSEQFGQIDILVNNAGLAASHKFLGHDDALWHKLIATNLTGTYYVTKAIVPGMVERRWGRVINIASIASKVGGRYMAAYASSKHGVLGLTRALATEFIEQNITVNAICPGYVDTDMTQEAIQNIVNRTKRSSEEARQALEAMSSQKRLIEPEEVAAVAVLLAGDSARGITGQAINIDGGSVMF